MKNRAVRVALFLLAVLAFAGAGYELALLDREAGSGREAHRRFVENARRLDAAVRELRAAQFAYVAAGQASSFWTNRTSVLLPAVRADIQSLCTTGNGAAGQAIAAPPACAAALDDLATIERIDASVRRYLGQEQMLLASDLVFSDLREADQSLGGRIDDLRAQQSAGDEALTSTIRRKQMATAAGATVFAVLVLLLLVPAGREQEANRTIARAAKRPEIGLQLSAPTSSDDAMLSGAVEPRTTPVAAAETAPFEWTPATGETRVDLAAAAVLCTDLARLRDTTELPPLLERAAALLHAAGIIVWMDDGTGGELRPALSHGYPPHALAHIHPISKDENNATARAYRERELRIVEREALSDGAIAAPLVAPDACIGVMAAEIRGGYERDGAVQAIATILAAQLATLLTPQPASTPSGS